MNSNLLTLKSSSAKRLLVSINLGNTKSADLYTFEISEIMHIETITKTRFIKENMILKIGNSYKSILRVKTE